MERVNGTRLSLARMWRNPPVRRLALILCAVMLIATVFILLYSYYSTQILKRIWLDQETAMLASLTAEHPEIAEDWLKLITQSEHLSDEALAHAQSTMVRYGLTEKLDTRWLPMFQDYRSRTLWLLMSGTVLLLMLLSLFLLRESRRQLSEIRSLALSLEDTVKHNQPMTHRMYDEGEIGLLATGAQELTLRLRQTIEQLDRDKAFLKNTVADISHQLKTPLASLMIYMDLLLEGEVDAEHSAEFLRTCRRELDRMEWLTLTLLKIARLEADVLDMSLREAPLLNTVRLAVNSIRRLAEDKQIDIHIEDSDTSLIIPHDSHWLAEALANLLKNAVEHSPPGSTVTVGWERTPVFIRLLVKDQGIGIDAQHLPHIFKKFYRTSSEGSGVGLGLPLAKSIIEKHGGMLSAAANSSGGTVFILTLPLQPFPTDSSKLTVL